MAFSNFVYNQSYIHSSSATISSSNRAAPLRPLNLSFSSTFSTRLPSRFFCTLQLQVTTPFSSTIMAAGTGTVSEILPPALDSSSPAPAILDGTTKLYISYISPYAQRVWIARNYKGLQDKIKLVPIDLQNRPDWYKEKVYPPNKVPALEHNNEVIGESLDLLKYLESNFDGPSILPDDSTKKEFAEQLLSYTDTFGSTAISAFKGDGSEAGVVFDYLENGLGKFNDGPFFLGNFSLVDIAYAPFIERFRPFLLEVKKYDVTENRPKLASWIEAIDKIEAYTVTKHDPKVLLERSKKRYGVQ